MTQKVFSCEASVKYYLLFIILKIMNVWDVLSYCTRFHVRGVENWNPMHNRSTRPVANFNKIIIIILIIIIKSCQPSLPGAWKLRFCLTSSGLRGWAGPGAGGCCGGGGRNGLFTGVVFSEKSLSFTWNEAKFGSNEISINEDSVVNLKSPVWDFLGESWQ